MDIDYWNHRYQIRKAETLADEASSAEQKGHLSRAVELYRAAAHGLYDPTADKAKQDELKRLCWLYRYEMHRLDMEIFVRKIRRLEEIFKKRS